MRTFTSLAVLVGLSAFADAYGPPPPKYNSCPDNKCKKSATPYCSSYLKVPEKTTTIKKTKTSTITKTSTKYKGTKTVSAYPVTTEVKTTTTPITTSVSTVKTDTTTTTTVAPRCTAPSLIPDIEIPGEPECGIGDLPACIEDLLPKRSYPPSYSVPKPKCFDNYKKKDDIKSACKCVDVKPSTKTVKKTVKTVSSTTTTYKTVNKKTVTITPTATSTKTITASASTKTDTTTVFTTTVVSTVTAGDIAIPTGAFNIVLTGGSGSLTALNGLRGTVDVTNVNNNPINFLSPVGGELPLGTSFTLVNGALTSGDFTSPAYLTDLLGNDPQQVSFDNVLDMGTRTPMSCSIVPNNGMCELVCSGTPANPTPVDGGEGEGGEGEIRKRGRLLIPDPVPALLATPYLCGLDNSYYLGGGTDDEAVTESVDAQCVPFVPVVVDVEPLAPTPGEGEGGNPTTPDTPVQS